MKSWGIIFFSSFALLTACSSVTTENLRADPHEKGSVVIDQPYEIVFPKVAASANQCFPGRGVVTNYSYSTSTELDAGKLAKVEVVVRGTGTSYVILSLDIRSEPNGTEIDYFVGRMFFGTYDNSSSFAPIAREWANGNGKICS